MMKRRTFITLLGGATAWPVVARAQQTAPVVGLLGGGTAAVNQEFVATFLHGLADAGFVEGRNVAIEYRWAEGNYDRLPALVAELVSRRVGVIAAVTLPAAMAAKAVTGSIPIVFMMGSDAVKLAWSRASTALAATSPE